MAAYWHLLTLIFFCHFDVVYKILFVGQDNFKINWVKLNYRHITHIAMRKKSNYLKFTQIEIDVSWIEEAFINLFSYWHGVEHNHVCCPLVHVCKGNFLFFNSGFRQFLNKDFSIWFSLYQYECCIHCIGISWQILRWNVKLVSGC